MVDGINLVEINIVQCFWGIINVEKGIKRIK